MRSLLTTFTFLSTEGTVASSEPVWNYDVRSVASLSEPSVIPQFIHVQYNVFRLHVFDDVIDFIVNSPNLRPRPLFSQNNREKVGEKQSSKV